jgi:starch phosphorylase
MEACGTSGMKAALNGVLNCSIRDGWWDEMSADRNGFDIPSFEDDPDLDRRDRREASATFDVIEHQIVPSFYGRGDDGVPHDWIDRIITNWTTLGWNAIAGRMVRDYVTLFYEPAAVSSDAITADAAGPARELAEWKARVTEAWPGVRITLDPAQSSVEPGVAGASRDVIAYVDAGSLSLSELSVQAVHGPVQADGSFDEDRLAVIPMTPTGDGRFAATFTPERAGRWGVSVRALPTHPLLTGPFDVGLVVVD